MNIDKIKTKTFYETYVPCRCGDCKLYYSSIEKLHPLICAYLRELGVNPLKPFELMSISPDNQNLEFVSCQYLLFGTIEGDYKKEIDGILIEKDDHHPSLETNDDYFVISFGPVKISINSNYRHLLKEEKVDCILHIIKKYDPIDMQNIVPKNEYYQEAVLIEKELSKRKHYFGFEKYIQQMFKEQFGKEVKHSICTKIFREIMIQLSLERDLKDYYDHSSLKNKFSYSDGEFKLKIHDGFIVTSLGNMTYINEKKYYDIEEQDLLDSYIDFIEDDSTIYVQYKHKHLNLFSFSFFKEYEKSKYEFNKLRHKKDIELVFDNKNVLYRAKSEK